MDSIKPIQTVVLDTAPVIKNEPPVSTLIRESESITTTSAVISEIKDAATRSRVNATLLPFLTIRDPGPKSVKIVTDFARRTGDLAVLSRPDIQVLALTYEIECERNGGDWRLRRTPGQKGLNGSPPSKITLAGAETTVTEPSQEQIGLHASPDPGSDLSPTNANETFGADPQEQITSYDGLKKDSNAATLGSELPAEVKTNVIASNVEPSSVKEETVTDPSEDTVTSKVDSAQISGESHDEPSDSDSAGWITPSNIKKRQAEELGSKGIQKTETKTMQAAILTTDFAMQNVALQMNLNLLSPSLSRVKHLKTFVLRCHACFQVTKEMSRQFCPKCGQPTLTRVSCSTDVNGAFKLHLKKNMQWNTRGDRYSVPKPVHGSANGRVKGGGKGAWGHGLLLAEDQKEYQRASKELTKQKERNLMDEDYLPGILTGDRGRAGGRIKVGAGRNVNSKKR